MRLTSCVGIGLESVCGGAQEFRDGRQVPITFVRVDVPEVDREVGQQRVHVQTLLILDVQVLGQLKKPARHSSSP